MTAGDAARSRAGTAAAALALALAGIGLHLAIARRAPAWTEGGLADTDSYLRLLRVLDLWRGAGWCDSVLPRLAPPEGLALHWTRPLDLLIIGGTLPAMLAGVEPAQALHRSAALICPALRIQAALAAVRAARPVWPENWSWLAGIAVPGNLTAVNDASFGRADHHALVLVCVVGGFALRAAAGSMRAARRRAGPGLHPCGATRRRLVGRGPARPVAAGRGARLAGADGSARGAARGRLPPPRPALSGPARFAFRSQARLGYKRRRCCASPNSSCR